MKNSRSFQRKLVEFVRILQTFLTHKLQRKIPIIVVVFAESRCATRNRMPRGAIQCETQIVFPLRHRRLYKHIPDSYFLFNLALFSIPTLSGLVKRNHFNCSPPTVKILHRGHNSMARSRIKCSMCKASGATK